MKNILIVFSILCLLVSCEKKKKVLKTGGKIAERIEQIQKEGGFKDSMSLESVAVTGAKKFPFEMLGTAEVRNAIAELKPDNMKLSVPINGKTETLLLYKVDLKTNVKTDKGDTVFTFTDYRGIVQSDTTPATVSLSEKGITASVTTKEGTFTITPDGENSIIYLDSTKTPFSCGSDTLPEVPGKIQNRYSTSMTADATTKCVNWYWEIDYDLYQAKGSNLAATVQYMHDVFAQVATLYANDGITIGLRTLFVWTSEDPYIGPATNNYLAQFGDYLMNHPERLQGDLAHLIGTRGNGGIAWIGAACSAPMYQTAYSAIQTSFNNVPTYSWTISVLAHEQGHNLGSRHTHDCVWNGNSTRIDSCGDYAGYSSCGGLTQPIRLPQGGGTIMSYCHLTSAGINFSKGFGPQPSATMIWNINNAFSCLTNCGPPPPPPPPNNPPVADAGDDKAITTNTTTLTGSGTDDVAVTQSYWGYVSGTPPLPNLSGNGNTATASNLHTGVYQFAFKVIDGGGLSNSDTMQLTVNLVGPPPPPPPSGPIFSDNFNRTVLENGWTSVKGGWQLSNNELNNTSSTTAQENILIQQTFYDTAQADFAGVDMNTGPKFGLVMCYQSVGNYYLLYRNTGGTSQFRISKVVNGTETILKTKNTSNPVKNQFFKLRGRKVGNILYLDFNGVNQASVTDATFGTGATGVFINAKNFKHRIDNFAAQ